MRGSAPDSVRGIADSNSNSNRKAVNAQASYGWALLARLVQSGGLTSAVVAVL